jgi:hypothetical protein
VNVPVSVNVCTQYPLAKLIVPPVALGTEVTKVPEDVKVWIVFPPEVVTVPPNAFCSVPA